MIFQYVVIEIVESSRNFQENFYEGLFTSTIVIDLNES